MFGSFPCECVVARSPQRCLCQVGSGKFISAIQPFLPFLGDQRGSRLHHWLCPSLKRPKGKRASQPLHFGLFLSQVTMVTTSPRLSRVPPFMPNFSERRQREVRMPHRPSPGDLKRHRPLGWERRHEKAPTLKEGGDQWRRAHYFIHTRLGVGETPRTNFGE